MQDGFHILDQEAAHCGRGGQSLVYFRPGPGGGELCQQRDPGPESGHPGRRSRTDEGVWPSTNGQELLLGTGARHDPLVLWPSHRMSGEMGVIDDNVTTDAHRMACQVPDDPVAVSGRDDQLVFGGIVGTMTLVPMWV